MTATVITHPAAADLRSKIACAEEWADDLYMGRRIAEEWDDGLRDTYGGQQIAIDEAESAAADLRRELAALEQQAEAQAPTGSTR